LREKAGENNRPIAWIKSIIIFFLYLFFWLPIFVWQKGKKIVAGRKTGKVA